MCGRFTHQRPTSEIAQIFEADDLAGDPGGHFNVAPTDEAAVVVQRDERRAVVRYRWGLVPSWADPGRASKAFNARSETASAFTHLFTNPWLWGAIALSLLLQVAVVNLGFLNLAFGTVPLSFDQWLLCAAMASVVLWYSELRKLASRAWSRRKGG